jgi:predicted DNA-binding WGR domain protein
MARFEFTQGTSSKFWEVSHRGTKVTVRWGKIGTTGQSKVKTFANALKAGEFQAKLVREKIGKSYIPCDKEANRLASADVPMSAKKSSAKKVVSPAKTSRPKGGAKDLSPRKVARDRDARKRGIYAIGWMGRRQRNRDQARRRGPTSTRRRFLPWARHSSRPTRRRVVSDVRIVRK